MAQAHPTHNGFTLLEMLIAVGLLALLLAGVGGATIQVLEHLRHTEGRLQQAGDIHAFFDLLEHDLSHYTQGFTAAGPTVMTFTKTQEAPWLPYPTSGEVTVGYLLQTSGTTVIAERSVKDIRLNQPAQVIEVIRLPKIEFSYMDNQLVPFPLWVKAKHSPVALRVVITDTRNQAWERIIPLWSRRP